MELDGFAKKIKSYRENNGYSQEQLAAKLYVTRKAVSKWENGKCMPDLQTLCRLSDIIGISIDSLLKQDLTADNNYYNFPKRHNEWISRLAILYVAYAMSLTLAGILTIYIPYYIALLSAGIAGIILLLGTILCRWIWGKRKVGKNQKYRR